MPLNMLQLKCSSVNRKLVPLKLVYFLFYGGMGANVAYLVPQMKHFGLSTRELAVVSGVTPIVVFFIRFAISILADKLHMHRLMFVFNCILAGALLLVFGLLPPGFVRSDFNVENVTCTVQQNCSESYCQVPVAEQEFSFTLIDLTEDLKTFYKPNSRPYSLIADDDDMAGGAMFYPRHDQVLMCYHACCDLADLTNTISLLAIDLTRRLQCSYCEGCSSLNERDICPLVTAPPTRNVSQAIPCVLHCLDAPGGAELLMDRLKIAAANVADDPDSSFEFMWEFWVVFFISMMQLCFYSSAVTLLDTLALGVLGKERRNLFGRQRLFGSFAFGLFAVLTGVVIYYQNIFYEVEVTIEDHSFAFFLTVALMFLMLVPTWFLRVHILDSDGSLFRNMIGVLRKLRVVLFLLFVLGFGIQLGIVVNYVPYYVKDLKGPSLILGIGIIPIAVAETIMMYFSKNLLDRLGPAMCMNIAMVAYGARMIAYALIRSPWPAIPIEILHGVSMGLILPATTAHGQHLSPPGALACVQALIQGIHLGLGRGLGGVIGGLIYESYGAKMTFYIGAAMAFAFLIIFALSEFLLQRMSGSKEAAVTTEPQVETDADRQPMLPEQSRPTSQRPAVIVVTNGAKAVLPHRKSRRAYPELENLEWASTRPLSYKNSKSMPSLAKSSGETTDEFKKRRKVRDVSFSGSRHSDII